MSPRERSPEHERPETAADGDDDTGTAALLASAQSLVTRIVRRVRRSDPSLRKEDEDEMIASVLLRLMTRLRQVRDSERAGIASIDGYVATLVHNAVHDFRRGRHPERTRLKNRLRYVLTHDPRLALWPGEDDLLCGLAAWRGRHDAAESIAIDAHTATPAMRDRARPADAVTAILRSAGSPVTLSALIRALVEIWHVHESSVLRERADETPAKQLTMLESREELAALWSEIAALPQQQSAALLLNMRDTDGGNAAELFLLLDVAPVERLAAAMGLGERELEALWERLPLDDLTIASMMGLTRQQVINLRKAARTRLARRTARDRR